MKFVRIKKYIKESYDGNPSFIIELDDNGVIIEYISNGCKFVENTGENIEHLIDKYGCGIELEELLNSNDLENYDDVTNCYSMLRGCSSLTSVNLSLPSATDCSYMLLGCSSLTEVTLSLPKTHNCEYMLWRCSSLTGITLSLPKAIYCYGMLRDCSSLTEVTLSLPSATDCRYMLRGCSSLTEENTNITYLLN